MSRNAGTQPGVGPTGPAIPPADSWVPPPYLGPQAVQPGLEERGF